MSARDEAELVRLAHARLLARAGRATGSLAATWAAFVELRDSPEWPGDDELQVAALSNMAAVALFGDTEDLLTLDALIRRAGHERIAKVQAGLDGLLGLDAGLPVTTAAVRLLGDRAKIRKRLACGDLSAARAASVGDRVHHQTFWLLLSGSDGMAAVPPITTVEHAGAIIARGNARIWRAHLLPLMESPWGPYGDHLVRLAGAFGGELLADVLDECRKVYQARQEQLEREAIAKEIRRLVAVSGLSQRAFAAHVGTSPSRLSTYISGRVIPSAAMLVRIRRTSQVMQDRA